MEGTGQGTYSSLITGLAANTVYHVRAYATNSLGTSYGSDVTFTTPAPMAPTVTTTAVSSITQTTVETGGNVTNSGGADVTARGICWSNTANPTIPTSNNGTGTGTFSTSITRLLPNTTYHIRAYATNSIGTSYGADLTFTTLQGIPVLTTSPASSMTTTTANAGGNVLADGGSAITTRGVCWSTAANPTTSNSKVSSGTGTGTCNSHC
jgi:hypothetical protein